MRLKRREAYAYIYCFARSSKCASLQETQRERCAGLIFSCEVEILFIYVRPKKRSNLVSKPLSMNRTIKSFACGLLLFTILSCKDSSDAEVTTDARQASAAVETTSSATVHQSAEPLSGAAAAIAEGKKHFEDYRNDEAIAAFRRATEIDAQNGEAHYRLGLALADAGEKEAAEKSFERAIELFEKTVDENEDDIAAQRYLALANSKLGNHAEAVKAYKEVVRLEPDESNNHYELGLELNKLAQYPEAVQALKKALQLDPESYRAAEALDRAQEGVKRREAALRRQEEELRRQDSASGRARSANSNTVRPLPMLTPTQEEE